MPLTPVNDCGANRYTRTPEPYKQDLKARTGPKQEPVSTARTGPVVAGHMALTQRLQLRQSHALVMTPQLMQAIKLLQLSNLDLAAYVDNELERNPLLEQASEGDGQG